MMVLAFSWLIGARGFCAWSVHWGVRGGKTGGETGQWKRVIAREWKLWWEIIKGPCSCYRVGREVGSAVRSSGIIVRVVVLAWVVFPMWCMFAWLAAQL